MEGRSFTVVETSARAKVAVVSQATARKLWLTGSPRGQAFAIDPRSAEGATAAGVYQWSVSCRMSVRQARELGADVIKADPTDDSADYHEVIQAARCPVLVRGGGREPVETVFRKAHALLQQGARGLVYGRNVYQHAHPAVIVKAFLGMLHDGLDGEQAWALYREHEQAS
ncbi:MAG TPA: hypothetical protein VFQ79_21630 [Bryobacteraceae bacterium]|nr:hypothetical protein [Bryobacteraceae bacterium]